MGNWYKYLSDFDYILTYFALRERKKKIRILDKKSRIYSEKRKKMKKYLLKSLKKLKKIILKRGNLIIFC